ncbi:MAG: hypothetical protein A2762_02545 [Candidatus Lloydbacteria bacterium RIFCSPHIGHO2_01_FULL_54_11]|nr:MAG: hypothetical protein A2762_02545 [Candidatus Lloydbacteria bacterium RIFCSPHIGHO2_01_FULL_54_11]OGZ16302.1 MAG: hypothetical protein A3H76_04700 [Candidatus Lloydbacteria bacterium RIFCSPLOWO2_02_FULL_54_12]
MWFWRLASLGCAGVLDLVAGLFFTHLLSGYFAHPLFWWQYAIGALLGASPDIDLFYACIRKNATGHHEYLTHRPIVGIPLAIVVGWVLGGEFWAWCAGVGVLWHYLHDTQGFLCLYDSGLAWCWPFSKKYWGVQDGKIVSQTLDEFLRKTDSAFENIYEVYLVPTRRSVFEFLLTGVFVGVLAGDLFGVLPSIVGALFVWIGAFGLWIAYGMATSH